MSQTSPFERKLDVVLNLGKQIFRRAIGPTKYLPRGEVFRVGQHGYKSKCVGKDPQVFHMKFKSYNYDLRNSSSQYSYITFRKF